MTAAPVGAVVSITYDSERDIAVDHVLVTQTERLYRVIEARKIRGRSPGSTRWSIRAIIVDVEGLPDNLREHQVHRLVWHSRDSKPSLSQRQAARRRHRENLSRTASRRTPPRSKI